MRSEPCRHQLSCGFVHRRPIGKCVALQCMTFPLVGPAGEGSHRRPARDVVNDAADFLVSIPFEGR